MLRRFEMYALRSDADPVAVERLERAFLECGRFIPEVLHSAVGTNLSRAPVQLVWEHAYESPAAYQRYMVHPYHAGLLDRYLLSDSPERIVTENDLAAGLIGYACDDASYVMTGGVRRLVLLGLAPAADADLRRFADSLRRVPEEAPEMALSVVGSNTMGSAWFDGVTPLTPPPVWTHVWEQGFATVDDLHGYLDGESASAALEASGWAGWMGGLVRRTADVYYCVRPSA
jgi:hypothetical protein